MMMLARAAVVLVGFLSLVGAAAAPVAGGGDAPYTVYSGNKVDDNTFAGWKLWQSGGCESCHGSDQKGGSGPSLNAGLKTLTPEQFKSVVLNGRAAKGMPRFGGSARMVDGINSLYGYLKARSDGAIPAGAIERTP